MFIYAYSYAAYTFLIYLRPSKGRDTKEIAHVTNLADAMGRFALDASMLMPPARNQVRPGPPNTAIMSFSCRSCSLGVPHLLYQYFILHHVCLCMHVLPSTILFPLNESAHNFDSRGWRYALKGCILE